MSEPYTPTTEEVREEYAPSGVADHRVEPGDHGWDEGLQRGREEFDRWLKDVRAKVLEDLADEGERFMFGVGEQKPADDEWNIAPRWHEIRRLREKAAEIREGKA